jgi:hypothetical protein
MQTIQNTSPTPMFMNMNILAFLEDSRAPAVSPAAILLFTCAAKMIDAMPRGGQQNMVATIAGIK